MISASGLISSQLFKIFSYPFKIIVVGKNICCNIHFYIMCMCEFYSLFHFFHREIFCFRTQARNASPPIYTASAPKITAVFNTSRLLAGINSSIGLSHLPSTPCFMLTATPSPKRNNRCDQLLSVFQFIQIFPHSRMYCTVSAFYRKSGFYDIPILHHIV